MFADFFYFIVALLIYATYQSPEQVTFTPAVAVTLTLFTAFIFFAYSRFYFHKLKLESLRQPHAFIDRRIDRTISRMSIIALAIYAVDIYVFNLPAVFNDIALLTALPTLLALMFLVLFIGFLCLVWAMAHDALQAAHPYNSIRRSAYIRSHIVFAAPVLMPWVLISLLADGIRLLPYEAPKAFLNTSAGEMLFFLSFLFIVAIFGPVIIQRLWGCKPLEDGFYRQRIEALCHRANVEYRNLMYWPIFEGKMITAAVMGLVQRFRYILVTQALFSHLTPEEVDSVIAHEIGHIKRRHLHLYLLLFLGYMGISWLVFLLSDLVFYSPFGFHIIKWLNKTPEIVSSIVLSTLIILLFFIYFRFIFGYFMRNFERQADTYVFSLFPTAMPLVTTLEKISFSSGQSPDKPNWHHFSIRQRIDFLVKCEKDRSWIAIHDKKIRTSLIGYLAAMALIFFAIWNLNSGSARQKLNLNVYQAIIEQEIQKKTPDLKLLSALGNLMYSHKDYAQTIHLYATILEMDPLNAEIQNNLAWLLVTCENAALRDPPRALLLARQSVKNMPKAHTLDTLAEAYFANKNYSKAVDTAKIALSKAAGNRQYYTSQIARFETALGKNYSSSKY